MLSIWIFFQEDKIYSNGNFNRIFQPTNPIFEIPGFRILNRWRYALTNLRPGDHFGSRRARGWGGADPVAPQLVEHGAHLGIGEEHTINLQGDYWLVATHIFLEFSPRILGEDEPILTSIFFRWVGSTTN